jgi:hypothetical protein
MGEDLGPDVSQFGEGAALVYVGDRAPLPAPGPSTFLEGRVVQLALVVEEAFEEPSLTGRRLQEVAKRAATGHRDHRSEGGVTVKLVR